MTKDDYDFDLWYGYIKREVYDRVDVEVQGPDSFQQQYADGEDADDVVDEICAEYDDPDTGYDDTDD